MKTLTIILSFILIGTTAFGQPKTEDPAFELELQSLLNFDVHTISIKEFKKMLKNEKIYILDAREKEEYDVSHIKNAKLIGTIITLIKTPWMAFLRMQQLLFIVR